MLHPAREELAFLQAGAQTRRQRLRRCVHFGGLASALGSDAGRAPLVRSGGQPLARGRAPRQQRVGRAGFACARRCGPCRRRRRQDTFVSRVAAWALGHGEVPPRRWRQHQQDDSCRCEPRLGCCALRPLETVALLEQRTCRSWAGHPGGGVAHYRRFPEGACRCCPVLMHPRCEPGGADERRLGRADPRLLARAGGRGTGALRGAGPRGADHPGGRDTLARCRAERPSRGGPHTPRARSEQGADEEGRLHPPHGRGPQRACPARPLLLRSGSLPRHIRATGRHPSLCRCTEWACTRRADFVRDVGRHQSGERQGRDPLVCRRSDGPCRGRHVAPRREGRQGSADACGRHGVARRGAERASYSGALALRGRRRQGQGDAAGRDTLVRRGPERALGRRSLPLRSRRGREQGPSGRCDAAGDCVAQWAHGRGPLLQGPRGGGACAAMHAAALRHLAGGAHLLSASAVLLPRRREAKVPAILETTWRQSVVFLALQKAEARRAKPHSAGTQGRGRREGRAPFAAGAAAGARRCHDRCLQPQQPWRLLDVAPRKLRRRRPCDYVACITNWRCRPCRDGSPRTSDISSYSLRANSKGRVAAPGRADRSRGRTPLQQRHCGWQTGRHRRTRQRSCRNGDGRRRPRSLPWTRRPIGEGRLRDRRDPWRWH
mmetsp:Transcript_128078/g.370720  ORF Transcript_128078/g.370720 Transcript_128078/m.370720 type:complete len:663 (-) Transcript_128078:315-2303(-)